MAGLCRDCKCPVDAGVHDAPHCRNGGGAQLNLRAHTAGVPRVKCCRCAPLPGKDFCLFCIDQQQKEWMEAADGMKQSAIIKKRKASEEFTKTGQELDAARKDEQAARSKIEAIQKKIEVLKEERKTVDGKIAQATRELAKTEEDAERQKQRVQELESSKKRRKTEELEANRTLKEVDKLLSPSRQKSHPSYWKLDCDADDAPRTEYHEVDEPESLQFFQDLIKKCSHDDCNLSSLRDSELLGVRRVENKTLWEVYEAKKRKLIRKLQEEAKSGGRAGPAGGVGGGGATAPAVVPALLTGGVQEFLKNERWDADAGEAFLFHGVSSAGAASEIAENGFNRHFARQKGMFGSGCYFTDQFCKSAFYANQKARKQKDSTGAVVLVCRVSMGHHFQVPHDQVDERDATRAPRKCACSKECMCGQYYDSVVAETDVTNGRVRHGPHREIVVYDSDLVYPEFFLVLGPVAAAGPSAAPRASAAQATPVQSARSATTVEDKVKAIVAEMEKNIDSAEAQQRGCAALCCFDNPSDCKKEASIVAAGAVDAAVAAMNRHAGSAEVQVQACQLLWRCARVVKSDELRGRMAAAVIAAMRNHGATAKMQEYGCFALYMLAISHGHSIGVKIAAAGGIEAVIAAMEKHGESALVVEIGCKALRTLARINDNRQKILAAGGGTVVLAVMQKHTTSDDVQSEGKALLTALKTSTQ